MAHLREMFAFLQRWKWLVTVRPIDIVVSRTLDEHAALLDFLAKIPLDKQKRILLGYYEVFFSTVYTKILQKCKTHSLDH